MLMESCIWGAFFLPRGKERSFEMKEALKRIFVVSTVLLMVVESFLTGEIKINAAGASGETTVYVTKSGDRYHGANCGTLRKGYTTLTLQEAIDSGYKPCNICQSVALDTISLDCEREEAIEALKTYEGNTKDFNAYIYYIKNIDLWIEVGPDGDALLEHYLKQGKEEERIAIEERIAR